MKLLFVIVVCLLQNVYSDEKQDITKLSKKELSDLEDDVLDKCKEKHNVDEKEFEDFDGFSSDKPEGKKSKEFKCMMGCFAEEMGYIKDNQPQWEIMLKVHRIEYEKDEDFEKAKKIVETCKTIVPEKESDTCELGASMADCYVQESDKIGLELV